MRYTLIIIWVCLSFSVSIQGQIISTFAGGGTVIGDGGPATVALIDDPGGIVFDKTGALYITCGASNRIRKIDAYGYISTIAGTGTSGYSGDGGQATSALLNFPNNIILDTLSNIFFCDAANNVIRKIDKTTGIISTICGNGTSGYSGDSGPATSAQLNAPNGICFDKLGNLYIADEDNHRVRKINSLGIISTYVGTGIPGFNGDGNAATNAQLFHPIEITTDNYDNIFIADGSNRRIRKVDATGIVSTFAGNGIATFVGDEMQATNAQFIPTYLKFDYAGNLFISDPGNFRIYKIDESRIFHLVAGDGSATNSGDGGVAVAAAIHYPSGLAFDSCNNLYFGNVNYNKIRKVSFNPLCLPLAISDIKEEAINIYPNPIYDLLQIDNILTTTTYRLHNIVGTTLLQGTLKEGSNSISLNTLPAGMYLLELIDDEGNKKVKKIIKE